jgi:hypothetical protein
MKALNFNNTKKTYLNVTLTDGTVLLVGTPTKRIFDELIAIKDNLDNIADSETLSIIYDVCALIMSRNKTGKEITKEYLEEIFDVEDIIMFFKSYVEFMDEVKSVKN